MASLIKAAGSSVIVSLVLDTKEFSAGLKQVQAEAKTFSDLLARTGQSTFLEIQSAAANAGISLIAFSAAAAKVTETFTKFERAVTLAAASGTNFTARLGNTEKDLAAFRAEIDKNAQSFAQFSMQMSEDFPISAQTVADGFFEIAQAGVGAQEAMRGIRGVAELATISGQSISVVGETVAQIGSQFDISFGRAKDITDDFMKSMAESPQSFQKLRIGFQNAGATASEFGMSLQETASALNILAKAGVPAGTAGIGLRNTLVTLAENSTKLQTALGELGLEFEDVNPNIRSYDEILTTLSRSGISATQVFDIFGKRTGQQALIMLRAAEAADKLGKKALELNQIQRDQKKPEEIIGALLQTSFKDVEVAKNALVNTVLALGDALSPVISQIANGVKAIAQTLSGLLQNGLVQSAIKMGAIVAVALQLKNILLVGGGLLLRGAELLTSQKTVWLSLKETAGAAARIYKEQGGTLASNIKATFAKKDAATQELTVLEQQNAVLTEQLALTKTITDVRAGKAVAEVAPAAGSLLAPRPALTGADQASIAIAQQLKGIAAQEAAIQVTINELMTQRVAIAKAVDKATFAERNLPKFTAEQNKLLKEQEAIQKSLLTVDRQRASGELVTELSKIEANLLNNEKTRRDLLDQQLENRKEITRLTQLDDTNLTALANQRLANEEAILALQEKRAAIQVKPDDVGKKANIERVKATRLDAEINTLENKNLEIAAKQERFLVAQQVERARLAELSSLQLGLDEKLAALNAEDLKLRRQSVTLTNGRTNTRRSDFIRKDFISLYKEEEIKERLVNLDETRFFAEKTNNSLTTQRIDLKQRELQIAQQLAVVESRIGKASAAQAGAVGLTSPVNLERDLNTQKYKKEQLAVAALARQEIQANLVKAQGLLAENKLEKATYDRIEALALESATISNLSVKEGQNFKAKELQNFAHRTNVETQLKAAARASDNAAQAAQKVGAVSKLSGFVATNAWQLAAGAALGLALVIGNAADENDRLLQSLTESSAKVTEISGPEGLFAKMDEALGVGGNYDATDIFNVGSFTESIEGAKNNISDLKAAVEELKKVEAALPLQRLRAGTIGFFEAINDGVGVMDAFIAKVSTLDLSTIISKLTLSFPGANWFLDKIGLNNVTIGNITQVLEQASLQIEKFSKNSQVSLLDLKDTLFGTDSSERKIALLEAVAEIDAEIAEIREKITASTSGENADAVEKLARETSISLEQAMQRINITEARKQYQERLKDLFGADSIEAAFTSSLSNITEKLSLMDVKKADALNLQIDGLGELKKGLEALVPGSQEYLDKLSEIHQKEIELNLEKQKALVLDSEMSQVKRVDEMRAALSRLEVQLAKNKATAATTTDNTIFKDATRVITATTDSIARLKEEIIVGEEELRKIKTDSIRINEDLEKQAASKTLERTAADFQRQNEAVKEAMTERAALVKESESQAASSNLIKATEAVAAMQKKMTTEQLTDLDILKKENKAAFDEYIIGIAEKNKAQQTFNDTILQTKNIFDKVKDGADTLQESLAKPAAERDKQFTLIDEKVGEKAKDVIQKYKDDVKKIETENAKDLEKIQKDKADALINAEQKLADTLVDIAKDKADRLEDFERELASTLADIEKDKNSSISQARQQANQKMSEENQQYRNEVLEKEKAHAADLVQLEEEKQGKIKGANEQYLDNLSSLANKVREVTTTLKDQEKALADLDKTFEDNKVKAAEDLADKRIDLEKDAVQKIKEANEDLADSIKDLNDDIAQSYVDLKEDYEKSIVDAGKALRNSIADVDRDLSKSLEELDKKLKKITDPEGAAANNRLAEMQDSFSDLTSLMKDQEASQSSLADAEITRLRLIQLAQNIFEKQKASGMDRLEIVKAEIELKQRLNELSTPGTELGGGLEEIARLEEIRQNLIEGSTFFEEQEKIKLEEEKAKLEQEARDKKIQLEADHLVKLADLNTKYQEDLIELQAANADKFRNEQVELQKKLNEALLQINQEKLDAIAEAERVFTEETLPNLAKEFEGQRAEIFAKTAEDLAKATDALKEIQITSVEQFNEFLNQTMADSAAGLTGLMEGATAAQKAALQAALANVSSLKEGFQTSQQELAAGLSASLIKIQEDFTASKTKTETQYQDELNTLRAKHIQDVNKINSELQAAINEANTKALEKRTEAQAAFDAKVAELESDSLRRIQEAKETETKAKLDADKKYIEEKEKAEAAAREKTKVEESKLTQDLLDLAAGRNKDREEAQKKFIDDSIKASQEAAKFVRDSVESLQKAGVELSAQQLENLTGIAEKIEGGKATLGEISDITQQLENVAVEQTAQLDQINASTITKLEKIGTVQTSLATTTTATATSIGTATTNLGLMNTAVVTTGSTVEALPGQTGPALKTVESQVGGVMEKAAELPPAFSKAGKKAGENFDKEIKPGIKDAQDTVKNSASKFEESGKPLGKAIATGLTAGLLAATEDMRIKAIDTIKKTFGLITQSIGPLLTELSNKMKSELQRVFTLVQTQANNFLDQLAKVIDKTKAMINQLLAAQRRARQLGGNPPAGPAPTIQPAAKGDMVNSPEVRLIGEAGPEAVVPLDKDKFEKFDQKHGFLARLASIVAPYKKAAAGFMSPVKTTGAVFGSTRPSGTGTGFMETPETSSNAATDPVVVVEPEVIVEPIIAFETQNLNRFNEIQNLLADIASVKTQLQTDDTVIAELNALLQETKPDDAATREAIQQALRDINNDESGLIGRLQGIQSTIDNNLGAFIANSGGAIGEVWDGLRSEFENLTDQFDGMAEDQEDVLQSLRERLEAQAEIEKMQPLPISSQFNELNEDTDTSVPGVSTNIPNINTNVPSLPSEQPDNSLLIGTVGQMMDIMSRYIDVEDINTQRLINASEENSEQQVRQLVRLNNNVQAGRQQESAELTLIASNLRGRQL